MCLWKNWKKVSTKYRNIIQLSTPTGKAWESTNSRKGYWRVAKCPILQRNLDNSYWNNRGLKSLINRINLASCILIEPPCTEGMHGGVRGRELITPSYLI